MGNNISFYFGAYLEIRTNKIERTEKFRECKNGHRGYTDFCSKCGLMINTGERTLLEYPTLICDHILGNEYVDVLSETTPPPLFRTGTIIAIGNAPEYPIEYGDDWLSVGGYDYDVEMKEFPTQKEIDMMKKAFCEKYPKIIQALRQSPIVKSAVVKAGYVLNAEY